MRNVLILAAAVVATSACVQTQYTGSPDGRATYEIACPAMKIERCGDRARQACPNGYEVTKTHLPPHGVLRDRLYIRCIYT